MPKETTHWIAAQRTASRLIGTKFGAAAKQCPHALQLGAVFPDLPYYLTGSNSLSREAAVLGNRYHGQNGEDTYDLLRAILRSLREEDTPVHRAFLVGVISHLCLDFVFHPLVYFETGNYYDPVPDRRTVAIRNHRRFEGLLDVVLCGGLRAARQFRAQGIWAQMETPVPSLLEWAARHQGPDVAAILKVSNESFLKAQHLFVQPLASGLAGVVEPWLSAKLRELTALFYRNPTARQWERLQKPFEYRNPVSGTFHKASMEELFQQGVEAGVELCRHVEGAIGEGAFDRQGPSLNFGLVGAAVSQARYFADSPFFEGDRNRK